MIDIYFDVSDLYYRVRKAHNKKVNYRELLAYISTTFGEVNKAKAFGCQVNNEAQGFISHLRGLDIEVMYRRPKVFKIKDQEVKSCNWNVEITINALCSDAKTIVFCTSSPDLIPLYQHLQNMGRKVVVVACGVPESVRSVVDVCHKLGDNCVS